MVWRRNLHQLLDDTASIAVKRQTGRDVLNVLDKTEVGVGVVGVEKFLRKYYVKFTQNQLER
jgi:hypothetical protein